MKLTLIRKKQVTRFIAWVMAAAMISTSAGPAWGAGICTSSDLADVPLMLIAGKGPPPNFLIGLDNSYSMSYEVMTNDADRLFHLPGALSQIYPPPFQYLFHGTDTAGGGNSSPLEDTVFKNAWQSQCATYNKMYYNPEATYDPWPTKPAVNPDTPLYNPKDASDGTYDLTQTWATLTTATDVVVPNVSQETNGGDWYLLALNQVFPSGELRVHICHTVTSVDNPNADELLVGPLRVGYHDASGNHDIIIPPSGAVRTPSTGWTTKVLDGTVPNISGVTAYLTAQPGDYTATWTVTGLVPGIAYNIYTAWGINSAQERSDNLTYHIIKSSGSTATIKRRHFYVESGENPCDRFPYLVNLVSADTAEFYKVFETSAPDIVQNLDLIPVDYADLPADLQALLPAPAAGAYSAQLQNFANWFTYYRKRTSVAVNAIAVVISEMKDILVGMFTSPPTDKFGARFINTTFDGHHFDQTSEFLNYLYSAHAYGSSRGFTADILDMGHYYESQGGSLVDASRDKPVLTDPLGDGSVSYATGNGTYPYFTEEYGGKCQQAYALIITDGANPGGGTIKNFDRGYPTDGNEDIDSLYDGGVFGDEYNPTCADGAMGFYERDLKSELSDDVPTNYIDYARHQHMVVYGLAFGVDGPLRQAYPYFDAMCADINNDNACICDGGCPTWGDPNPSPQNPNPEDPMDDLWHATVNSRGLYMYADNPQELLDQLRLIKSDIERRQGAAAAVTTNSVERQVGTIIYQGLYNSDGWYGDLLAKNVDVATGAIGTTKWSAKDMLDGNADKNIPERDYTTRDVFASNGSTAVKVNAGSTYTFGTLVFTPAQVDYLLGDRSNEGPAGFRERKSMLGDIIHSEPFVFDDVVYIGANDGMMHAFDADTGEELFGYIPSRVIDKLPRLWDANIEHTYFVDATPHVFAFGTGTKTVYLAGGLGKGGKGVYCLNVTHAKEVPDDTVSADDIFNWEYKDPNDADLGYVFGRAYVVPTTAGPAVIFGNGYASDSGEAVLYVLDADDGSIIRKFETGVTGLDGCNGMSTPYITDYYPDGVADYVYAGDLDGNLWKFDLSDGNSANWTISYGGHPLFTARDSSGNAQPITSEPVVMMHCERYRSGTIVIFGTGRYLNEDDLATNVATQSIYGIYDWEEDLKNAKTEGLFNGDPSNYYLGEFQPGGGLSNLIALNFPTGNPAVLLQQSQVADTTGANGETYRVTQDNEIHYYDPYLPTDTALGQTNAGWYYNLPDSSERVVRNPIIRAGVAMVVANTINAGKCSGGGGAWLYMLDACSGGRPEKPQFDTNNDNDFTAEDKVTYNEQQVNPSAQRFDTFLFDPLGTPDKLYINDTFGNIIEQDIPEEKAGLFYWRLVE